jgi:hypothetical protein
MPMPCGSNPETFSIAANYDTVKLVAGDIQREEIEQLFAGLPELVRRALVFPQRRFQVAPGWDLIEDGHGSSYIENAALPRGKVAAIQSTPEEFKPGARLHL